MGTHGIISKAEGGRNMATDPVCGMDVNPKKAKSNGLTATKNKKTFYFCSKTCLDKFQGKQNNLVGHILSVTLVALAVTVYITGYMLPFMGTVLVLLAGLKLIDLRGFAELFTSYDLIAKKSRTYAFIYPFIELGLGMVFLFQFQIKIAAVILVIVMSVSAVGVGKNVFSKNPIRCACLGAKIKVPLPLGYNDVFGV